MAVDQKALQDIKNKALSLAGDVGVRTNSTYSEATNSFTPNAPVQTGLKDRSLSSPSSPSSPSDPMSAFNDSFNSSFAPEKKTIMQAYEDSRSNVGKASDASAQIIKSQYGTAEEDAVSSGEQTLNNQREGQRGFASSPLALSLIASDTDKRVRGLTKDKNELLLQNEYEKASKLSSLIVDEQTALTNARTRSLNEYFGFKQEARAEQTQQWQGEQANREQLGFRTPEQLASLDLASKFPDAGVSPSDDFATAQSKIISSPSYKQNVEAGNLELEATRANIEQSRAAARYSNAQTQKTLMDVVSTGGSGVTFTGTDGTTKSANVSPLTKAIMDGTGSLKELTPTDRSKVITEMSRIGYNPKSNLKTRMESLIPLWEKVPENYKGPVEGRLYSIGGYGASTNSQVAAFESARTLITREVARLFDVGVLSDMDVANYNSAMPSLADKDVFVAKSKLSGVSTALTPASLTESGGTIRVREKTTGRTGSIPQGEFDGSKYEKI